MCAAGEEASAKLAHRCLLFHVSVFVPALRGTRSHHVSAYPAIKPRVKPWTMIGAGKECIIDENSYSPTFTFTTFPRDVLFFLYSFNDYTFRGNTS